MTINAVPAGNDAPSRARWSFEALDMRPVRRWLAERAPADGYRVTRIAHERGRDTWYDSADWRFHRAGLALRVRTVDDARVVETVPRDAGLEAARCELPAEGALRLAACPGTVGERVRALAGAQPPEPRVELDVARETWRIERAAGIGIADLHLVDARSPADGAREHRVELARVEIEERAGAEAPAIAAFVERIRDECRLMPGGASTYDAALFALGAGPGAGPDLGPTRPAPDPSIGEVAFAVLRRHFGAVLRHEPGTRLGEDIEELHDMRVGTRRMRAALKVFAGHLPRSVLALGAGLKWLGGALGEVRDLDVGLEQLEDWRHSLEEEDAHALDFVGESLARQRATARRRMLRALDSKRYASLVERVARVLRAGPGRRAGPWREPARLAAPDLIRGRRRRVVRPGRRLDAASPDDDLHRLRIRCKAFRYTIEFLEDLYAPDARPMIRRIVKLQDLLGDHQDASVAIERLRGMVEPDGRTLPPHTVFVIGRLAERYTRRKRELRAGYPRAFRGLRGKPWHRLRARFES